MFQKQGIPIPAGARRFVITIVTLFVLWQLVYRFIMLPYAVPDNVLTKATGWMSARVLSFFFPGMETHFTGYMYLIRLNGENVLGIAKNCNGLELMALYAGVLIALPGTAGRKMLFSTAGIAAIFLLNIARCCLLVWLHVEDAPLYEFAHQYAFKLAVYFAAFYGWTLYLKQYRPEKAKIVA